MMFNLEQVVMERYKVVQLLNEGGMSYIYLAADLRLNFRLVVLKVLKRHLLSSRAILRQEAMTLTQLSHPNLPKIYDYLSSDEDDIIVMEFVEGQMLLDISDKLSEHAKVRVLQQIAAALAYLHERPIPIVHRDIKPSNIIIDVDLNVKVIDFGISVYSYTDNKKNSSDEPLFGTPYYVAPELMNGEAVTYKADVYSFAILILHLWGKDILYFNRAEVSTEYFITRHFKQSSHLLQRLLLHTLQRKPHNRTLNFNQILHYLKSLLYALNEKQPIHSAEYSMQIRRKIIVCLNLNRMAGSTTIAINLTQQLSNMGSSISYIELEDKHSNSHMSYLYNYIDHDHESDDYEKLNLNHINFYFKRRKTNTEADETLQQLNMLLQTITSDIVVIDLSSSLIRYEVLKYLPPVHQLIVVSSPEIIIMNEDNFVNAIKEIKSCGIPLIHLANRQLVTTQAPSLENYLEVSHYIQIPLIKYGEDIKEKCQRKWLRPNSKFMKELNKYIDPLKTVNKAD